jgi:outer membrane receptor for monomeric catechols
MITKRRAWRLPRRSPGIERSDPLYAAHQLPKDPDAGYRNFLPAYGTVKSVDGKYIPRDFNVSDPDYDQSWREQTMIGYELEHQFADNLTFRQNARYATIKQKYRYLVYATSAANSSVLTRRAQHEDAPPTSLASITSWSAW